MENSLAHWPEVRNAAPMNFAAAIRESVLIIYDPLEWVCRAERGVPWNPWNSGTMAKSATENGIRPHCYGNPTHPN